MEVFSRRRLHSLGDLLSTMPEVVSASKLKQFARHVDTLQRSCGMSDQRRHRLEKQVEDYLARTRQSGKDLYLAILSVLLERYARRVHQRQRGLFDKETDDAEPTAS